MVDISKNAYDEFSRSTDGLFNTSIFLSLYNDLIIFVEDTDRGNIYETLFKRILDIDIKFESIHLSGGKKGVKENYYFYKENPIVPSFFLVDLDFDDIHGHEKVIDENFLYLNMYSIENYFIDEHVAGNFVNPRLQIGFDTCLERINLPHWLDSIQNSYKGIISIFLTIQSLSLEMPNTKLNAERFLKPASWEIDSQKVSVYYEDALNLAIKKDLFEEFNEKIDFFNNKIDQLYRNNYWFVIPGKQLLTLFWKFLIDFCPPNKRTVYLDDFYHLCASHCDITKFSFLKNALEQYLYKWVTPQK